MHYKPTSFPLGAMPLTKMKPAVTLDLLPGDILVLLSDGFYEYLDVAGEEFGERRVEEVVREHGHKATAELLAQLFGAVDAFARGAPQDDDMTAVLVKRDASGGEARSFGRAFGSLAAIFGFSADFFARHGIDRELLSTVDLALEELFTNMVKYSTTSDAEVRIEMTPVDGGVEVTMIDYDVEPFDMTRLPEVDVTLPIEARRPGGLGLHLIRRLLDSIDYEYSGDRRQSRITFRKTGGGSASGP